MERGTPAAVGLNQYRFSASYDLVKVPRCYDANGRILLTPAEAEAAALRAEAKRADAESERADAEATACRLVEEELARIKQRYGDDDDG